MVLQVKNDYQHCLICNISQVESSRLMCFNHFLMHDLALCYLSVLTHLLSYSIVLCQSEILTTSKFLKEKWRIDYSHIIKGENVHLISDNRFDSM